MYRGCPSWKCPLLRAVQLGQGEGPIRIVGPMSQPCGIIDTASLTLISTRAHRRFPKQFYSRKLRQTCIVMQEVQRHTRPIICVFVLCLEQRSVRHLSQKDGKILAGTSVCTVIRRARATNGQLTMCLAWYRQVMAMLSVSNIIIASFVISSLAQPNFFRFFQEKSNLQGYTEIGMKK